MKKKRSDPLQTLAAWLLLITAAALFALAWAEALTPLDAVLILCVILLPLSIGYWLRVAYLAAKAKRKVFDALPQTPAAQDVEALERQRYQRESDAVIESRWNDGVARRIARRDTEHKELPALLRRQAG